MKKENAQKKATQDFSHFSTNDWKLYHFKKQIEKEEQEEAAAGLIMLAIYSIIFVFLFVCAALDGLVML